MYFQKAKHYDSIENKSNLIRTIDALAHGGSHPEILLTLSYNNLTGRLMIVAEKGSHFYNLSLSKPPGLYLTYCFILVVDLHYRNGLPS